MSFDKQEWFKLIEGKNIEWDEVVHPKQLAQLINAEAMVAVLGLGVEMIQDTQILFMRTDFTTQDGVAKAIRAQGKVEGINDFLQLLADKAEEGNDEDGE